MDEVAIPINGMKHWLCRAIDANENVLIQPRRNARATRRFFVGLVAAYGETRVVNTDKLRSYNKPI